MKNRTLSIPRLTRREFSSLRSSTIAVLAIVTNLPFIGPTVHANDWSQWRGANRDAKAIGFTAPSTWPKQLTQKWKVVVGEGVASPALVGDKLYVFSREQGNEVTRCLDVATGKEVWQDKYEAQGATGPASGFSGPRSSPTVANGKIVTVGVRGTLSCLDVATGKQLWRKDDFQGATPMFFTSSSPLVEGRQCFAQLGGRDNGAVVAYDLTTGDQKWKWSGDSPGYGSPVLMNVEGAKQLIALTERRIVALNPADGKLAWEIPFALEGRGAYNAVTPIVDGSTIIFSGSRRGTKAMKVQKEGDAFAAKELWTNADKSVQFNTPVLKDGLLYGLSQSNEFFCINAQNGQTAWSAPAGPSTGGGRGGGFGSIVDAGSVLLALTPSSELIAFQPGDKAYTELARIKVADTPTHAYPILSGNRIFIKDKESVTLWAIE